MHLLIILGQVVSALAALRTSNWRSADVGIISDRYIVKLKSEIAASAIGELKSSFADTLCHEHSMDVFQGFAGTFTAEEVAWLKVSDQVAQ
jgi:hypothetical protein